MTDLPAADWYTDPEDPAQYRYWDGSAWTEHRAPRHTDDEDHEGSGHRRVGDLLAGTWRLATANWRPLVIVCVVVLAVYLVSERFVLMGFDRLFGDTLTTMIDDLSAVDTGDEDFEATFEDNLERTGDRLRSLGTAELAEGAALLALGALAVAAVNIVEFASFGQIAVRRLGGRPSGARSALLAGLRRLPRLVGVALMLLVIVVAATMVLGLVTALVGAAPGAGASLALVMAAIAVAAMVGAVPLFCLAMMTAAVGPAEPSLRYARRLLAGAYWATLGRMLLLGLIFAATATVLTLGARFIGIFVPALEGTVLAALSILPEMLLVIASFTLYHDLGGESG